MSGSYRKDRYTNANHKTIERNYRVALCYLYSLELSFGNGVTLRN